MKPEIKLVIFDVDGTLCDRDTTEIYPHMIEKLKIVAERGLKVALATNQGGVGLRYWMITGGFGEPEKYPGELTATQRVRTIADQIKAITGDWCAIYISFAYQSKSSGNFGPIPPESALDLRWSPYWRKPSPGMLEAAIAYGGTAPRWALFIGDSDEDREAAERVGCHFCPVGDIDQWL